MICFGHSITYYVGSEYVSSSEEEDDEEEAAVAYQDPNDHRGGGGLDDFGCEKGLLGYRGNAAEVGGEWRASKKNNEMDSGIICYE